MRCAALVLCCTVFSSIGRGERILFVLKDGRELFGAVFLDKGDRILLKRAGGLVRVDPRDVVERVRDADVDRLIALRRTLIKDGDAQSMLRLAILCLETERSAPAVELVSLARRCMAGEDAEKVAPEERPAPTPPPGEPAAREAAFPWEPSDRVALRVDVTKTIQGKAAVDRVRWSRLAMLLRGAEPPFSIVPLGAEGAGDDFVLKVDFEARIARENKFFDGVPVTREWHGRGTLRVICPRTGAALYSYTCPLLSESASVNLRGEELVFDEALERLIGHMKTVPGFRLGGSAELTPTVRAHSFLLRKSPRLRPAANVHLCVGHTKTSST